MRGAFLFPGQPVQASHCQEGMTGNLGLSGEADWNAAFKSREKTHRKDRRYPVETASQRPYG
jgi:hypothetical protein